MNQLLVKLLVYAAVLLARLDIIIELLKTEDDVLRKHASTFAKEYDALGDTRPEAVSDLIWNPTKVMNVDCFIPYEESSNIGSGPKQGGTTFLSHDAIFSYDGFEWKKLLYGCGVVGLERKKLIDRIKKRHEFRENDFPSLTKEQWQMVTELSNIIKQIE